MTNLRGLTFLIAAVLGVLIAAPSFAAVPNVPTVQMTRTGFSPNAVTIAAGGSINWVNNDTVEHSLSSPAAKLTPTPLQPTDNYGFTFGTPGTYTVADAKNPSYAMTVTVTAAAISTVHMSVTPKQVVFGASVKLNGRLTPAQGGQQVTLEAQQCGNQKWAAVKTVLTTAAGGFSVAVRPKSNTTYRARFGSGNATVAAHVSPRLVLGKAGNGRFLVKVQGPATGSSVALQTRTGNRWKIVSTITVKGASKTVSLNVPKGTVVRASMSTHASGQCLDAGVSNQVTA
jgi:plastocyanin